MKNPTLILILYLTLILSSLNGRDIQYLAEEEKLARDVYRAMAEAYPDTRIFLNISRAEERHLAALASFRQDWREEPPGEFTDPELAELYPVLVARGRESFAEALKVGIELELQDIEDLKAAIKACKEPPLRHCYRNLLKASERHLRAFRRNLDAVAREEAG